MTIEPKRIPYIPRKAPIHMMLVKDGPGFYIEGVEIDHFGQGKTEEEAVSSFKKSLIWTIEAHIKEHGHLDALFEFIPINLDKDLE